MNLTKHIPNLITCFNLLSGCMATFFAIEGDLEWAAFLIFIAAFFDFMDGLLARILKAQSAMGKELDSLADVVSFGVSPGFIAFAYLKEALLNQGTQILWLSVAFLIPVFSALRLAKFNVDTRQSSSFIGVPTPANAIFWASIPLVLCWGNSPLLESWLSNPLFVVASIVITSLFLVLEVPMFSLKMKSLHWKENKIRYSFLLCLLLLAIVLKCLVIIWVLPVYIIFSLLSHFIKKK